MPSQTDRQTDLPPTHSFTHSLSETKREPARETIANLMLAPERLPINQKLEVYITSGELEWQRQSPKRRQICRQSTRLETAGYATAPLIGLAAAAVALGDGCRYRCGAAHHSSAYGH